jgi:hypothetical protein
LTTGPLFKSASDKLTGSYTFKSLGTRFFTVKGFDAGGKLVSQSSRSLSVLNSPLTGNITCLDFKVSDPGGVNVRKSPNGDIMFKAPDGEKGKKLGEDGQWTRAQIQGKDGYMFTSLLSPDCP